jgi:hypothetical protein
MTRLLTLLVACGAPASDARLYVSTLELDPSEAHAACGQIAHANARADCQTFNAMRTASTDFGTAEQFCAEVSETLWTEECSLLIAEAAELSGPEAVRWCGGLERFRGECAAHALGRAVRSAPLPLDVGDESALRDALTELVGAYEAHAPPAHREQTVERLVAKLVSQRWGDGPFDVTRCGTAGEDTCRLAYRFTAMSTMDAGIEAVCDAEDQTGADLVAAGAPAWTEASETIALAAWAETCEAAAIRRAWRRGDRTRRPPPPLVVPL